MKLPLLKIHIWTTKISILVLSVIVVNLHGMQYRVVIYSILAYQAVEEQVCMSFKNWP